MTYSSSLSINRSKYYSNNQNTVSFSKSKTKVMGPISNTVVLIVLACLVGLLYLTQVTKTNSFGYQINALQQEQSQLVSQQNNLQVASAQLQSVNNVQNSQVAKAMTSITPSTTLQN